MIKRLLALLVATAVFMPMAAQAEAPLFSYSFTAIDETNVDIKNDRGTVVVLLFWATYDKPSRDAASELVKLHRQYHDKLAIYGVALDPEKQTVETYTNEYSMNWPEFWDGKGPQSDSVKGIVHLKGACGVLVVDKSGHIVAENPTDIAAAVAKAEAGK